MAILRRRESVRTGEGAFLLRMSPHIRKELLSTTTMGRGEKKTFSLSHRRLSQSWRGEEQQGRVSFREGSRGEYYYRGDLESEEVKILSAKGV